MNIVERLKELMDNEARSCSMDYGCITPIYVYRMWGGSVSIEEIENGLTEIRKKKTRKNRWVKGRNKCPAENRRGRVQKEGQWVLIC